MHKIKHLINSLVNLHGLIVLFLIAQLLNVVLFLGNRNDSYKLDFDIYLNSIKFTTIFLLIYSIVILILNFKMINKYTNILMFTFLGLILTLYFTMILHTDILTILSPTFFLILIFFILFTTVSFDFNHYLRITYLITYINLILVVLQILEVIPIAQENVRDSLIDIGNRPTGLFFNAFAMGYAMAITFFIFLNEIYKFGNKIRYYIGLIPSFILIYISGTRTVLIFVILSTVLILFIKQFKLERLSKTIVSGVALTIFFLPLILIFVGNMLKISELASINGRTQLWTCVTSRWSEFFPFGIGVQAAFPQGFCSDDPWFAKLRHPENMFLLNYVEAGVLGILSLILVFVFAFKVAEKYLKQKEIAPFLVTSTILLSSMFYVPLFHYVPFLPNRTADRGVFNFYLIVIIWIISLTVYRGSKYQSQNPKNRK